ncbi:MAG: ATP12 family protein [Pseudomonadota bacterium]
MRDILNDLEDAEKADAPDPMVSAQKSMAANLPKRFYDHVTVEVVETGHAVMLDGKPVRTPARHILATPSAALTSLLAAEWGAQEERIDPRTMPLTRLVNTALDGVAQDVSAVVEDMLRFASNDMLFYRAPSPVELVERQRLKWDPILDHFETSAGVRFELTEGVMHITQSDHTLDTLRGLMADIADPIEAAALHTITTLTGSALLALAMRRKVCSGEQAWELAHLDEDWNIAQWGEDEEAARRRAVRWQDMKAACQALEPESN